MVVPRFAGAGLGIGAGLGLLAWQMGASRRGATMLGSGGSKVCSATAGTVAEGRRYRSESSGGTKDAWERWPTARRAAMKTH